jgi:hypothetical protein
LLSSNSRISLEPRFISVVEYAQHMIIEKEKLSKYPQF